MTREFLELTHEKVPVTDLLTQSREDSLSKLKHHFDSHQFFHDYKQLQVMLFPSQMIETDRFRHIAHLEPDGVLWYSKLGHKQLFYELRSVDKLYQSFDRNSVARSGGNSSRFFYFRDCSIAPIESAGVAKGLQSEKKRS